MGTLSLLILLIPVTVAQEPAPLRWDRAAAEHLWNRAGFGADGRTLDRALELGAEGQVAVLLAGASPVEEPFYGRHRADGDLRRELRELPEEERRRREEELRERDREQLADYLERWVGRMLAGEDPLRERMTLFWHGHFTTSMGVVKSSYEMIAQNRLFRRHALGSFRELLHGVVRDPAMLVYLDNASSRKGHPNENFARELLELFTLGAGNYAEEDVREVARAFTGWGQEEGRFRFDPRRHDRGEKRVLGVEGWLDGDDVVAILLRQEACARHVARELLRHFEGADPAPERVERYAALLRGNDYRIDGFLRALFLDPAFYAPELRGQRPASPLDFLVGSARRLGADADPRLIVLGSTLLGERLFFPPSVAGWEGGASWVTAASLLLRGELAGLLLGRVRGRELAADLERAVADGMEPEEVEGDAMQGMQEGEGDAQEGAEDTTRKSAKARRLPPELRALGRLDAFARLNLTGRLERAGGSDAALAAVLLEEILAVPPPAELAARVAARLRAAREDLGFPEGTLLAHPDEAEPLLRELAHGVLSLPEAQLD